MKITYKYSREKSLTWLGAIARPGASRASLDAVVAEYVTGVWDGIGARYPQADVEVLATDGASDEVVVAPADVVTDDERFDIAREVRHIAWQTADELVAEYRRSASAHTAA